MEESQDQSVPEGAAPEQPQAPEPQQHTPQQVPPKRKAVPVLVVELDDTDDTTVAPTPPPGKTQKVDGRLNVELSPAAPPASAPPPGPMQKVSETLNVQVSPDAPAVVLPPQPMPLAGAPAVLAIGVAALVACFIPVVNLIAPLLGVAAAGTGLLMVRTLDRKTYLTGRGVVNTAILLGVISTTLGLLCYVGWISFWAGAR